MPACRHSAAPHSLSPWPVKLFVQAGLLQQAARTSVVWVSQGEPLALLVWGMGHFRMQNAQQKGVPNQHEQMRTTT
jgi:hypothetical protein